MSTSVATALVRVNKPTMRHAAEIQNAARCSHIAVGESQKYSSDIRPPDKKRPTPARSKKPHGSPDAPPSPKPAN